MEIGPLKVGPLPPPPPPPPLPPRMETGPLLVRQMEIGPLLQSGHLLKSPTQEGPRGSTKKPSSLASLASTRLTTCSTPPSKRVTGTLLK